MVPNCPMQPMQQCVEKMNEDVTMQPAISLLEEILIMPSVPVWQVAKRAILTIHVGPLQQRMWHFGQIYMASNKPIPRALPGQCCTVPGSAASLKLATKEHTQQQAADKQHRCACSAGGDGCVCLCPRPDEPPIQLKLSKSTAKHYFYVLERKSCRTIVRFWVNLSRFFGSSVGCTSVMSFCKQVIRWACLSGGWLAIIWSRMLL